MMNCSHDIAILFGSQTGNAEDVAYRIAREAKRHHKIPLISCLDDYDISNLVEEKCVVLVVATTGQGDPTTNMMNFWKFIWRKKLPSDCLVRVDYAVLGLGDSSYQKFNMVAKKLNKRLALLGGHTLMPCCLGDDQHELGYNAAINPWLESFWMEYLSKYPIPQGLTIIPSNQLLPPKFKILFSKESDIMTSTVNEDTNRTSKSRVVTFDAPVLSVRRVTKEDHWQDVRLISLDLTGSHIRYNPGDVCWVMPKNSQESVSEFMTLFNFDPDFDFVLECTASSTSYGMTIPQPCSMKWLVENYLDIVGLPKQYFWEVLAALASSGGDNVENGGGFLVKNGGGASGGVEEDIKKQEEDLELEKEKLIEFLTPQGQNELFSYCYRPRRNISEVLMDFPQTRKKLTLARILDIIHPMRPRVFSIASSQLTRENQLEILVATVNYKTRLVRPRKGLCSNYLASLMPAKSKVTIHVEIGTLKFPKENEPIIMVGPGTGCAPFRSYVDQCSSLNIGGSYLFFGCRNSDKDFFFDNEWKEKEGQNLMKLFTAFSRDQEEKIYVQHVMVRQGALLWDLIHHKKAYFMLAGNSKSMPESVREALKNILVEEGQLREQDAENYLADMERSGRYQTETWS